MSSSSNQHVRPGIFSLQSRRDGDIWILRLAGELDLANAAGLETELNDAMADGACRVVVDMSELEFIDSTGIAILVSALGRANGDDKLRFVPSRARAVNRVLQVTGIEARMPLVEDGFADRGVSASGAG